MNSIDNLREYALTAARFGSCRTRRRILTEGTLERR